MPHLIHANQVGAFDVSKVSGIVRRVSQDIIPENGQTVFDMTVLDNSKRIIKRAYLEISGVAYEEKTEDNPNGMFTRPTPYRFVWEFTAANGGFDIENTMTVSLVIVYVANYGNVDMALKAIPMSAQVRATKAVIGDYVANPATYFEQYDLSSVEFESFLGANINSVFYCHSHDISFNAETKIMTLAGLQLLETDSAYFMVNVLTE